ncbi:RusA family crossover junction endodeoxyribonuclease [Streptomyces europaeiscabiei]|uniref:RusA family crossover junction endodeoxyribonuclease n=1 Tax=Streptomyces europaeiscabiei TaxID=146819 RepID=UPI0029A058CA|nr:RusA family crossover junction endodeoxyribonuclease [Streptomyces europaeiscabiei]MDX2760419.1 RusA family crossover junction endodeoxyribonuclease [Streptomyces europaeiscabiei]
MQDLPWDVVVLGVPASVQGSSSRRRRWKSDVAAAARGAWPSSEPPLTGRLQARITFFHVDAPLDTDNMLKPIQDALIGIVYDDDKQVIDVHGSVRDVQGAFRVFNLTEALAKGFMSGGPFVHIRIEEPPDEQELP